MHLDPSSAVPVFRQIADGIAQSIAAGIYQPGELVPSIRVLATRLLINPNTVTRAYEELEREGILTTRKGVGMAVVARSMGPARSRCEELVAGSLEQAVRVAGAAGLTRAEVDGLYERAWAGKPVKETAR